jgi:hypothetical protein
MKLRRAAALAFVILACVSLLLAALFAIDGAGETEALQGVALALTGGGFIALAVLSRHWD